MRRSSTLLSFSLCLTFILSNSLRTFAREVSFQVGSHRARGYLRTPKGDGPFPTVIFLHGGLGSRIGGDPPATVDALADAGFIGFAPIRRNALALVTSIEDTIAAIEFVKSIKNADSGRLAIIGFSRGGLLAFMSSTTRRDLKAIVLMAPAHGRGALRRAIVNAENVSAPTLILVSKNDNRQTDHVGLSRQIHTALLQAKKQTQLIVYPPYERDGHRLFFEVRPSYWKDVRQFLTDHLSPD